MRHCIAYALSSGAEADSVIDAGNETTMWKLAAALFAALFFLACGGGEEGANEAASTGPTPATAAPTRGAGIGAASLVSVDLCRGVLLTASTEGISETPFKESVKTPGIIDNGAPAWSRDGRRFVAIVFFRPGGAMEPGLYLINADGTGARRLIEESGGGGFADAHWSPDGTRVEFARFTDDYEYTVQVVSVDGTDEKKLADGRFVAWSSDGTSIMYLPRLGSHESGTSLFSAKVTGGQEPQKLVDIPPQRTFAISPDGTQIAYIASVGEMRTLPGGEIVGPLTGLFLLNTDGQGTPRQVLAPGELEEPLAFSPDGTRLAYVVAVDTSPTSRGRYLEVVNLDGSNRQRLSGDLVDSPGVAQWSPDGSGVLIYGDSLDGLIFAPLDGSGDKKLEITEGCLSGFSPRPAPEG
jgi:Tol biopolymer transport system component